MNSFTSSSCKALAVQLPDIPLDAFKICTVSGSFRLQISQHAIGLVFGKLLGSFVATASRSRRVVSDVSVFCIMIWLAYSSVVTIRLSSLLRTIVADATAYFIMAMGLQTLVVLFLSFSDVRRRPLSVLTPDVFTFRILSANSRLCALLSPDL